MLTQACNYLRCQQRKQSNPRKRTLLEEFVDSQIYGEVSERLGGPM
jgi:hypothetical protein